MSCYQLPFARGKPVALPVATSVLHGYTLGKKGTTKYVVADLTRITDAFVEHCLNNPNDKALQALTRLAK